MPRSATAILQTLRLTRSVERTAAELELPVSTVQRVAWMAFGLGELEVALVDF
jgi:hypothetical protein